MIAGIVIGVIVVLIVLWLILGYNALVRARNAFTNAFAQIDVQLQRRHDLIPNLVETAKGYMKHERETLESVTSARTTAMAQLAATKDKPGDPDAMQKLGQSQAGLATALGRFNAVAEQYPDLKASQNMMQLSEQLTSTENKVAFARQAYNDSVMSYNNRRQSFPSSMLAGMFGFGPAAQWEIGPDSPDVRVAPTVQF